jgi:hypothetical protein
LPAFGLLGIDSVMVWCSSGRTELKPNGHRNPFLIGPF